MVIQNFSPFSLCLSWIQSPCSLRLDRLNMTLNMPLGIVLKTPVKGGISATLNSGAKYEYAQTTDVRYASLMEVGSD